MNIASGDTVLAHQVATLTRLLLISSNYIDNYCEMGPAGSLSAHARTENLRLRADRYGRLRFHPSSIPFIALTSLSYGGTLGQQTTYTGVQSFVEDGRTVIIDAQPSNTGWAGPLQFGALSPSRELLTTVSYTAGYVNTLLAADATAGASMLPVLDATGIQPSQALRVFDPPAGDETIQVTGTYVPSTGPTTLPLTTGLVNPHVTANPVRVSAMPDDVTQACIFYTIAMLMRPESTAESAFPDMKGLDTRIADSRRDGSGLVFEVSHLLEPYRRII
ncbi:MAG: hypothetical protein ACRDQX_09075 [Pseudonocardiaceae bacterium]